MSSSVSTPILVFGMLLTGTLNTLLSKYQDMQCVEYCDDPQQRRLFAQPIYQTLNMFVGEFACLGIVYLSLFYTWLRNRINYGEIPYAALATTQEETDAELEKPRLMGWTRLWLLLPTLCDICGTTLLNVGLLYVSASVFQMLRGGIVLFTGIGSVIFLGRRLYGFHWFGLASVTIGVGLVGYASVKGTHVEAITSALIEAGTDSQAMLGIAMILFALVFAATQFIVEERIFSRYHVDPLMAVGLEGFFGFSTVLVVMLSLHVFIGTGHGGFTDVQQGFHDFFSTPGVWATGIGICFSIGFFNFFGLSVTKHLSATARATVDASRTLTIWMISLGLGWERWGGWLQGVGFIGLVYGTCLFNGVIKPPRWMDPTARQRLPLVRAEE